jgi:hypothetical protein
MSWLAVTFYTVGTGYEREVSRLLQSAQVHNIDLHAYAKPNLGSWRANLNHKSAVILEAMTEHPDKDIVFIDADAVVKSYPALFDNLTSDKYDLAAHFYQRSMLYHGELLSGTLWIANTDAGRGIVERWHAFALAHPELRHQRCLHMTLGAARVYALPASYTRIFDARGMAGVHPVIEHFQASRKYRRTIKAIPVSRYRFGPVGCVR